MPVEAILEALSTAHVDQAYAPKFLLSALKYNENHDELGRFASSDDADDDDDYDDEEEDVSGERIGGDAGAVSFDGAYRYAKDKGEYHTDAAHFWADENDLPGSDSYDGSASLSRAMEEYSLGHTQDPAVTRVIEREIANSDGIRGDAIVYHGGGMPGRTERLFSTSLDENHAVPYGDPTGRGSRDNVYEILLPEGTRAAYHGNEREVILPPGVTFRHVDGNRYIAESPVDKSVRKKNPYHDAEGKFTTAENAVSVGSGGGSSAKVTMDFNRGTNEVFRNPSGDGYVRERQVIHDQIVQKLLAGHTPADRPVALVMGGGPAAGKTTMLSALTDKPSGVMVAPDDIKAMLPEWELRNTPGVNVAGLLHEESSDIGKQLLSTAASRKLSVIIDGTGDHTIENLSNKMRSLRDRGYKVVAHYATVPLQMALERATSRAQQTGRQISESVLRETHRAVSAIFPKAVAAGIFDKVDLWDTSGSAPKRIASAVGALLAVHDTAAYAEFINKALGKGHHADKWADSTDRSGVGDREAANAHYSGGAGLQSYGGPRAQRDPRLGETSGRAVGVAGGGSAVEGSRQPEIESEPAAGLTKANPYHGPDGRFTTAEGAGGSSSNESTLDTYLKMVAGFKSGRPHMSAEGFVLEHGQKFAKVAPLPPGVRPMKLGECYRNAALVAIEHPELTYTEGFATAFGVPMGHAWLTDANGSVIDPTWEKDRIAGEADGREYYGVKFDTTYLMRTITARGKYGLLYNPEMDFPLFTKGPEGIKKSFRKENPYHNDRARSSLTVRNCPALPEEMTL